MPVVNVGVIGTGGIASRHLHHLQQMDNAHIQAVCDIDEQKVHDVAKQYEATAFTDYAAMLDKEQLDALFICTPPSVRIGPVKAAAKKGVACFIEKPPAFERQEAQEITKTIEESGILSSVGFMYRYARAVERAMELLGDRIVPVVRSIYVCPIALDPNWPRWFFRQEISGGPLLDQAIHMLDATRYIVGARSGEVTDVQAFGGNQIVAKTEDFTVGDSHVLNLQYAGGTVHTHTHSWAIEPHQVRIELLSNAFHLIITLNPNNDFERSALSGHIDGQQIDEDYTDEDYYVEEARAFIEAVQANDRTMIRSPYADARKTLDVVAAANESVQAGRIISLE